MKQALPFLLSAITLLGMWLVGNKRKSGWIVGLANQALWLVFIIWFAAWGLLALNVALVFVYTRNLLRWRAEEHTGTITSVTATSATFRADDIGKKIRWYK